MRKISLFLVCVLLFSSPVLAESMSEAEGDSAFFGSAGVVEKDDDEEEGALFDDDRAVYEDYNEFIDVLSKKSEFYMDLVKIPIKNNYDKPLKFVVWGDVIGVDGLPYSGAVGETGLLQPDEKGYIEVNYSFYKDCTMTLVDYRLEDEDGNYLVSGDYYGIVKFNEPMVIEITSEKMIEETEEVTEG